MKPNVVKLLPLFSSRTFIVLSLLFKSNFYIWCKISVQLHTFACGIQFFPTPFVEEAALFPLSGVGILIKYHFTIETRVYF